MDASCMILTCLLLIQMAIVLIMLNPIYDVMKLTQFINNVTKCYRRTYLFFIAFYFTSVLYLGMYLPLQSIHKLIFCVNLHEYDKMTLLHNVEKNYITAGFSLFLVVVIYGVRALLSYTASLTHVSDKRDMLGKSKEKQLINENILPNLLKVKRSISYETVLFTNELREQLKIIIKNMELPHQKSTITSLLEAKNITRVWFYFRINLYKYYRLCFFETIDYVDSGKSLGRFWYHTGARRREIFQDWAIKIKCQYRSKGKKNVE